MNKSNWYRLVMIASVFATAQLFAESAVRNAASTLPAGMTYPSSVGIVYPGFAVAAGVNPAALAVGKRVTLGQLSAGPGMQAGDATTYGAAVASASNTVGWGLGYQGAQASGVMTHGVYSGVGFNMGTLGMGVGLRSSDVSAGFSPNIDIGARLQTGAVSLAAVAYGIDNALAVGGSGLGVAGGIGFGRPKKENVEINFSLPSMNAPTAYDITFSATIFSGNFGTYFRSTYHAGLQSFDHTLGGMIWMSQKLNFLIQLTTPRSLSAGISYVF